MTTCKDCNFRKFLAKTFDIHIDWLDCWNEDCEYKKQKSERAKSIGLSRLGNEAYSNQQAELKSTSIRRS